MPRKTSAERMDEFNPNVARDPFASYCPWRNPAFKTHSNRGHALTAITNQRVGIIYKLNGGQWEQLVRVDEDVWNEKQCAFCGKEMGWHGSSSMAWIEKKRDVPKFVKLCFDCKLRDKS